MEHNKLGEMIRRRRIDHHRQSLRAAAITVGVSRQTMCDWEGGHPPQDSNVARLAAYLGVPSVVVDRLRTRSALEDDIPTLTDPPSAA